MFANLSNIPVGYLWIALVVVFFVTVCVCAAIEHRQWAREEAFGKAIKAQQAAEWKARRDRWAAEKAIQAKLNREAFNAGEKWARELDEDRKALQARDLAVAQAGVPFPPTTPVRDTWPKPYLRAATPCDTQEVQSYSPPMYDSSVSDSCTSSSSDSSSSDSCSSSSYD